MRRRRETRATVWKWATKMEKVETTCVIASGYLAVKYRYRKSATKKAPASKPAVQRATNGGPERRAGPPLQVLVPGRGDPGRDALKGHGEGA